MFGLRQLVQDASGLPAATDRRHIELVVVRLIAHRPQRLDRAVTTERDRAGKQRAEEEVTSVESVTCHEQTLSFPVVQATSAACRIPLAVSGRATLWSRTA